MCIRDRGWASAISLWSFSLFLNGKRSGSGRGLGDGVRRDGPSKEAPVAGSWSRHFGNNCWVWFPAIKTQLRSVYQFDISQRSEIEIFSLFADATPPFGLVPAHYRLRDDSTRHTDFRDFLEMFQIGLTVSILSKICDENFWIAQKLFYCLTNVNLLMKKSPETALFQQIDKILIYCLVTANIIDASKTKHRHVFYCLIGVSLIKGSDLASLCCCWQSSSPSLPSCDYVTMLQCDNMTMWQCDNVKM